MARPFATAGFISTPWSERTILGAWSEGDVNVISLNLLTDHFICFGEALQMVTFWLAEEIVFLEVVQRFFDHLSSL